jgi:hypothetical protein
MTSTAILPTFLRGCADEDIKVQPFMLRRVADELERLTSLLTEVADHFDPEGLLGVESLRGWRDIYDDLVPFRSDSGRTES